MTDRLDTAAAVHPAWRSRLQAVLAAGYGLQSVWRSTALQARWWWCANNNCAGTGCQGVPGACPSANPPGHSYHEYAEGAGDVAAALAAGFTVLQTLDGSTVVPAALAVDLRDDRGDGFATAMTIGPDLGLHFPVYRETGKEPWHVQPDEAEGRSFGGSSPFPDLPTYYTTIGGRRPPLLGGEHMDPVARHGTLRKAELWHPDPTNPTVLRPTWDIVHPWPEGVHNGVQFSSTLHAYLLQPLTDPNGPGGMLQVPVRFWVPGGEQGTSRQRWLVWGHEEWAPVGSWDDMGGLVVASLVADADVSPAAVDFTWEFVPGVPPT